MATLQVQHVTQTFGNNTVLDDVSLEVASGNVACLLGPSGCGKTTLFNVVAGLARPLTGQVFIDDQDITGQPGHLAYMLQKDLLLEHKRILDNVCLPLLLQGIKRADARAQAQSFFAEFGLTGTEERWPYELSGGMRQRAALLRSYLTGKDIMLLDEPFSALDTFTKQDMHSWFLDIVDTHKITALVITHDIDEAVELSDTVYVMRGNPQDGKPSHIVGSEQITCPRSERASFNLTRTFLEHKQRILALLN